MQMDSTDVSAAGSPLDPQISLPQGGIRHADTQPNASNMAVPRNSPTFPQFSSQVLQKLISLCPGLSPWLQAESMPRHTQPRGYHMAGHRLKCPQARMMFNPPNISLHIKVALLHSPALSLTNQECLFQLEGLDLLWRHTGGVHMIAVPLGHEWKVPLWHSSSPGYLLIES